MRWKIVHIFISLFSQPNQASDNFSPPWWKKTQYTQIVYNWRHDSSLNRITETACISRKPVNAGDGIGGAFLDDDRLVQKINDQYGHSRGQDIDFFSEKSNRWFSPKDLTGRIEETFTPVFS